MSVVNIKRKLMGIYTLNGKLDYEDLTYLITKLDEVESEMENLKEIVSTEFISVQTTDGD